MSQNEAPLLVVAGVHDEMSLGWSAAQAWLERDPDNQLMVTVRGDKSREFVEAERESDERIGVIGPIDWTEPGSGRQLTRELEKKIRGGIAVSGLVHSVASAPPENFVTLAHELGTSVYEQAIGNTALSLVNLVQATRPFLRESAGVVTYGFSEFGRTIDEYGPALSTAKVALSHLIKELAVSLGRDDPPARTAEIVTGFIPTYAGRGVLAGIGRKKQKRLRPNQMEKFLHETSALSTASSNEQRVNAGRIAADFIANPIWSQTTGQRFEVNAGWPLISRNITPPTEGSN